MRLVQELNFLHKLHPPNPIDTHVASCRHAMIVALISCLLFRSPARADSLSTVSITSNAQFLGLRSCAGACAYGDIIGGGGLLAYIGCNYPFYNTCYCNSGIIPQASSFVSSCVSSACGEVADVTNAVSAWEGYCGSAGYPMNNVAQTTAETITSGTVTAPTTHFVTAPATMASTVTATTTGGIASVDSSAAALTSSANSNSQSTSTSESSVASGSSNVGAIAGGVVGGVVAIGVIAIIITMLILRDRRRGRQARPMAPPQAWQPPASPSSPPMNEKIPTTPGMTQTTPVDRGVWRTAGQPELDGRARAGAEMEGLGSYSPRTNFPEMQG